MQEMEFNIMAVMRQLAAKVCRAAAFRAKYPPLDFCGGGAFANDLPTPTRHPPHAPTLRS